MTYQLIKKYNQGYVYHLTPTHNLDSIKQTGLTPTRCRKFGALSPELLGNKKPKVFFIPVLNGFGMKGFLQEWWHDSTDITTLRISIENIPTLYGSWEYYYRKQELWSFKSIDSQFIEYNKNGLKKPYIWKQL